MRHGDTDWQQVHRCHGHSDIPLNADGVRKVERARERLRSERIDAVYSSDLQRALVTAQIVATPHGVEVVPCPELRELHFGEFEGCIFYDIGKSRPDVAQAWLERSTQLGMPGGESLPQVMERVATFLPRLDGHDQETVLIVGHSGSLRALYCNLMGLGLEGRR